MENRFEKIELEGWSEAKIRDRHQANNRFSKVQANDEALFLEQLRDKFGEIEVDSDDRYMVEIRDNKTNVVFFAYNGPTGPAYGGKRSYFIFEDGGADILPNVKTAVDDFEIFLTAKK